jgi:DNA-binding CsgD family transcriptional regulator
MQALGTTDLRACLEAVQAIGAASAGGEGFARGGVACLRRLIPSDLTTLSICDLDTGHRSVVSDVPNPISRDGIAAFDRHFDKHPLVRDHGRNPRARTRRISELVPLAQFRRSPLFDEYYRPIGIDHAMGLPVHVEGNLIVSFVFNRTRRDFTDRERDRLEVVRPHLGNLYRISRAMEGAQPRQWAPPPQLSSREQEVLRWCAAGKTDRDIAAILGISPRTVHKHLQRIYEKLGVETRTAAVMRAMSLRI